MNKKVWLKLKKSELYEQAYNELKEEYMNKLQELENKIQTAVKSKLKKEILNNIQSNDIVGMFQEGESIDEASLWKQVEEITKILDKLEHFFKRNIKPHIQPSLLEIAKTEEALRNTQKKGKIPI